MKTTYLSDTPVRRVLGAAFVLVIAAVASAVPVTFRVNLEVQSTLGNFVAVSGHTVEVHGSFDGWGPGAVLSASAANANVYEGTVDVTGAAGSSVQFKYVINKFGTLLWENDGVGPAGAQNRAVTLAGAAQTLPVEYFNNQTSPPGVVAVTFQVNLSIQEAIGNFVPGTHTVEVHGSFDNWGAGLTLSADPNNAAIYQGNVNINGSPGAAFEHKYVINQSGTLVWEGQVGPGGPNGNRVLLLGSTPQILPPAYFNNLTNSPGSGIPVTFQVDLGVAIARGQFDPGSGSVVVAGPFNSWSPTTSILTNSPERPSIYSTVIPITSVSPGGSMAYKFVLNGTTWEDGDNRVFTLASSSQTLPPDPFNRIANLGAVSVSVVTVDAFFVTVTWTPGPRVRLQKSTDLNGPWEEVAGSLGQGSSFFDLTFDEKPSTYFRLIGP